MDIQSKVCMNEADSDRLKFYWKSSKKCKCCCWLRLSLVAFGSYENSHVSISFVFVEKSDTSKPELVASNNDYVICSNEQEIHELSGNS